MEIQSIQHAINRKKYLERFLAQRPAEGAYIGSSEFAQDAVDQENRHNQLLADEVEDEIKNCENANKWMEEFYKSLKK